MGAQVLDTKLLCKLPFGAYAQVHDDPQITNNMEPRTTRAINLGPSNMQGGHKFLSLATGDIITRRKWTELPVPSEVILRLEELSGDATDTVENILQEEEENDTVSSDQDLEVTPEQNPLTEVEEVEEGVTDVMETEREAEADRAGTDEREEDRQQEEQVNLPMIDEDTHEEDAVNVSVSDETTVTSNATTQGRYNLRPNRTPNYLRRFAFLSVQAGIKRWGDKAREAVREELRTFVKEKVFKGLRKPTKEQLRRALMIHCFIIEKRDGKIKARAVADGRTQQRYSEEETYSPTVKLESIMLNAFIDAHEGRHVATVDIKGAFLKAPVPEDLELIVKMTGELAQLMCELDPELQCDENGVLYLKCEKALYGHIEAARLFYDDLDSSLQNKMSFQQNKYDPCVYNRRTPNGNTTIRVHVDDLKISSTSRKQLEITIEELRRIYGELTIHWGPEHDYLGMIITYHPNQKRISLNMQKYVEGIIEEFEGDNADQKIKLVKTPVTENLFQVRKQNNDNILPMEKAKQFHSTVAKLLFLAKRGRPDVLLAVSFLTTRVKEPDDDDWKKLLRVLGYLKDTKEYDVTIECSNMETLTWYIDGSYAAHDDMKGQSGATLMIGNNTVLSR